MIRLTNLSFKIGAFSLGPLNVEIEAGEYFVVLGPTGAGKTKLLEIVAGLVTADSGEVWVGGEDVTSLPPERRRIGFMYQDYLLFPHLTVRKNIRFGLNRSAGQAAEKRVEELAGLVGIPHLLDRSIRGLSGGEQQRIALARALAPSPRVLLLDEPLSALDPQKRKSVRKDLARVTKDLGVTTIHVTHDIEEALSLGDRLAIMQAGQIVQVGPPDVVFRQPNSDFVAGFFGVENLFRGSLRRTGPLGELAGMFNAVLYSNGMALSVVADREGRASAAIRPEEITVSIEAPQSSALNVLEGIISSVEKTGPLVRLVADIDRLEGVQIIAVLTSQSFDNLHLGTGARVFLSAKAAAIHIF